MSTQRTYSGRSVNSGSILLTLIVVIVLMSVFSITFLTLNKSSLFSNISSNFGVRAQYLAESGYRYAASEYLASDGLDNKIDRLEQLDNASISFSNNEGDFSLQINPFWFISTDEYDAGETDVSLKLKVPGRFVDGYSFPETGTVMILTPDGEESGSGAPPEMYSFISGEILDSQNASLKLQGTLKYPVSSSSHVFLVFHPAESKTILSGGDLQVNGTMIGALPTRNGQIEIDDTIYFYKELQEDPLTLKGLAREDGGAFSVYVTPSTDIVLKRQIFLQSTGHLAQESQFSASREVGYFVPISDEIFQPAGNATTLPLSDEPGGQDTFEDLENWHESEEGHAHVASSSYVTAVLKHGIFSDLDSNGHTEYVLFDDLDVTDPPGGYTLRAVNKGDLPASVRDKDFYGIWGDAADDLYVVGEGGTILHFNGRTWTQQGASITSKTLRAVWGIDEDHVVAVGNDGEVLVKDDGSWERMLMGKPYSWHGSWYIDLFAKDIPLSAFDLYGVWGTSWDHITTYGDRGGSPYKWNGSNYWYRYWENLYLRTYTDGLHWRAYDQELWRDRNFRCNWEYYSGNTQHLFAVGQIESAPTKGFIFREKPTDKSYYRKEDSEKKQFTVLHGIWGSSLSDIYAVGDTGSIYHNTSSGTNKKWKKVNHHMTDQTLYGVYGISEDFVYAVGDNGVILHKNADGWSKIENDVSTETLNGVWGNGDVNGLYAVGDDGTILYLGSEENPIKKDFMLLNKETEIYEEWAKSNYLSYTIQTKIGWQDELEYTATGICFRWHNVGDDKYEGYGVSFMKYAPSDEGNDFIPDSMKPDYKFTDDKSDRILVVLWKQYVQDNIEKRVWIAYKDITEDGFMNSNSNNRLNDLSSLVVRLVEKKVDGMRVNDIDIFYGDANKSNKSDGDTLYNNSVRKPYYPTFTRPKGSIVWPLWEFDEWKSSDDYFTVVDNVSVDSAPNSDDDYWVLNPFVSNNWLVGDGHTIRSNDFLSPSSDYGDKYDRPEIGICVYGDVGSLKNNSFVAFADFAVQLGAESEGINQQSSFGRLQ